MADPQGQGQGQGGSQLVTVNQNGVIALNQIVGLLQALNTSFAAHFGVLVPTPANATASGVSGQFAVNGTSFFWAYGTNTWAKVLGTTSF